VKMAIQYDKDYIGVVRCPKPGVDLETLPNCRRCIPCRNYGGEEKYGGLLKWLARRVICNYEEGAADVIDEAIADWGFLHNPSKRCTKR